MAVYQEILEWSVGRPKWQRDALRRLLHREELAHDEIVELADICESEFGVRAEELDFEPLVKSDIPMTRTDGAVVTVRSLQSVENVDLLAGELEFAPHGLTLVYGPNGSGKSGYARLLKKFCRARGADEEIRASVFAEDAGEPAATLVYAVEDNDYRSTWRPGAEPPDKLGGVSVFDTYAADVYVGSKNDVAYRPAGLDLLPRLATVCDAVRDELTRRQEARTASLPALPHVKPGTRAAEFLENITAKTKPVDIEGACTITAEARKRKKELAAKITALEAPERKDQAQALRQQAARIESVVERLSSAADSVSVVRLTEHRELKQRADAAGAAAVATAETRFAEHPVQPVGTALWQTLLESAEAYFEQEVAPGEQFPGDDRCVLCHQELSDAARGRLADFRSFVHRQTQAASNDAEQRVAAAIRKLESIDLGEALVESVASELTEEHAELADRIRTAAQTLADRRDRAVAAMKAEEWPGFDELPLPAVDQLRALAVGQKERADKLVVPPDEDELVALNDELDELRALEALSVSADTIKGYHRALVKQAQYDKCIKSAKTNTVSRQNGALIKAAVTETLERAFADEAERLQIPVPVKYGKGGTRKGEVLHNVTIDGAPPKTSPDGIASRGESQLIALANFFTEFATAPSKSAVILDDPASALDAENAQRVARRIVDAAGDRQVVALTHDERFVEVARALCSERGVSVRSIKLARSKEGTGLVTQTQALT